MRRCEHCDTPIGAHHRSGARYCDDSCRSAARHARTALSTAKSEPEHDSAVPVEDRQRRASASGAAAPEPYSPPPEWAWLAAYYASGRRSSEGAA